MSEAVEGVTNKQLPTARPRLMQRLAQWLTRRNVAPMDPATRGILRHVSGTVLRHGLVWAFTFAGIASAWRAAQLTGAARWWAVAGVVFCGWSATWAERSRVFNADEDDDDEGDPLPDPPASQVPVRRGPRQWR